MVLEEDARLQRLVEDLLLLTRIDEERSPTPRIVDLDDLLLEDAARLRATTELKIDVRSVSAGRVIGDAEQLERLIRNLTENAARHARGRVRLSLQEVGGARSSVSTTTGSASIRPSESTSSNGSSASMTREIETSGKRSSDWRSSERSRRSTAVRFGSSTTTSEALDSRSICRHSLTE